MDSKVWIQITLMVCITFAVSVFFVTGCEEKTARARLEIDARQTQYYKDAGYVREYNSWSGYHWVKPETKGESK